MLGNYFWLLIGVSLANFNLKLAYYFRENASQFIFPDPDEIKWFFLSEPVLTGVAFCRWQFTYDP